MHGSQTFRRKKSEKGQARMADCGTDGSNAGGTRKRRQRASRLIATTIFQQ